MENNKQNTGDLLDCPFCGCRPDVKHTTTESDASGKEHITRVTCLNCVGTVSIHSFPFHANEHDNAKELAKTNAYTLWNRRGKITANPINTEEHVQFVESLTKIIEYLEGDEKKDYEACSANEDAENNIYRYIVNVKQYIENRGLDVQNVLENSQNVDRIAKYLVAQFWLGAEIGIGNSSIRDMSQEQYYELNKNEWNLKAECLIKAIFKINTENKSLKPNTPTGRLIKEGDSLPRKKVETESFCVDT